MVHRSVRTWHHIQREIFLFWIPRAHPQSVGNTPRGSSKCPAAWHWAKTSGVEDLRQRLPRPRPVSNTMLGSRLMRETEVSTEGTGGSSGTSGSQMAKVQLPFTGRGCTQRRHGRRSHCTASGTKEHAGVITPFKMSRSHFWLLLIKML